MKRVWSVISGTSIVVAAAALWLRHADVAFVTAAIGLLAWFINYRTKLRQTLEKTDEGPSKPEE